MSGEFMVPALPDSIRDPYNIVVCSSKDGITFFTGRRVGTQE